MASPSGRAVCSGGLPSPRQRPGGFGLDLHCLSALNRNPLWRAEEAEKAAVARAAAAMEAAAREAAARVTSLASNRVSSPLQALVAGRGPPV